MSSEIKEKIAMDTLDFYLFPIIFLAIGWLLILIEWIQDKQASAKYVPGKRNKLELWNKQYLPLRTKIYTLFILTAIVTIILIFAPLIDGSP